MATKIVAMALESMQLNMLLWLVNIVWLELDVFMGEEFGGHEYKMSKHGKCLECVQHNMCILIKFISSFVKCSHNTFQLF